MLFRSDVEFFGTGFRSPCLQGLFRFLFDSKEKTKNDLYFDILLADASVLYGRDRRCA